MTEDELAQACADALWEGDRCSQHMGMEIIQVSAGSATLRMTVTDDMVNGHNTCHGGIMFMLADSAFAFACNSHNTPSVAQHCSVSYLQPAHSGDVLVATAVEQTTVGRTGIYDVTVTRGDDTVAEFRGNSRALRGQLVDTGA